MPEARDPRGIPELDLDDLPMALDRGVGWAALRNNFAAIVDTSTARLMPDLADSGELAPGQGISAPIEVLPKRYQPS